MFSSDEHGTLPARTDRSSDMLRSEYLLSRPKNRCLEMLTGKLITYHSDFRFLALETELKECKTLFEGGSQSGNCHAFELLVTGGIGGIAG